MQWSYTREENRTARVISCPTLTFSSMFSTVKGQSSLHQSVAQCYRRCHVIIFSCCSFEESDPTVSVTRKQNTQIIKTLMAEWWPQITSPALTEANSGKHTHIPFQVRIKQSCTETGMKPGPRRPLTHTVQVSSSSFRTCWISGTGPLPRVICHSSSVGGAAVCGHPHCLQLGWMVALHCSSLCHWRAFCFRRNTGLIHPAQWDCSQLLSIMRDRVRGAARRRATENFSSKSNSVL